MKKDVKKVVKKGKPNTPKVLPAPKQTVTIELPVAQLNFLMEVLIKVSLPYSQTAPVIHSIQSQLNKR